MDSGHAIEASHVRLKDGRTLGYAEYGDPAGFPTFAFHGMPGSRLGIKPFHQAAQAAGVRLIAPERPGYPLSTPKPGATLLDYPNDITELADCLGIERFAVMGVSGGAPYALACAYKLANRLTTVGVVSGIGPLTAPNSTHNMVGPNRVMFTLARLSPGLSAFLITRLVRMSLPSMQKHIQSGTSPMSDLSPEFFAALAADQAEAVREGSQGIAHDLRMLWQPWGFRFEDVSSKVYLWHGEADNLAPAALAHYIAERIPDCQAVFYPDEGHTDPLSKHAEDIIQTLVTANR